MPCEPSPAISFWTGALVAIVAATIAHLFSVWRESRNRRYTEGMEKRRRRIEFAGLIGGMRAEAERIVGQAYVDIFPKRLFKIRSEAAKIVLDFGKAQQERLGDAIGELSRLTDSQIGDIEQHEGEYLGRERVTSALDKIIAVVIAVN
jgi:hypothetical protein